MLNKVKTYIDTHKLLRPDGRYIVGLSGGADSVALLLILKELGYYVEAAHCNFHLRGKESQRDEEYCINLCKEQDIKLHLIHFQTAEYAEKHKVSIEMAARTLRYNYFEALRQNIGADAVCVAHHRDDSVETVLLNLLRGTGLRGLMGIRPRNKHIIRPLLACSKADIEAYLAAKEQAFVTDSSNLVADVKRNKLRLEVVPTLKEINPSFDDTIMKMSESIGEAQKIINASLKSAFSSIVSVENGDADTLFSQLQDGMPKQALPNLRIDIAALQSYVSPEYFLFYLLIPYGFTSPQVRSIASSLLSESGKEYISDSYTLLFDRKMMLVSQREKTVPEPLELPETGKYIYSEQCSIEVKEEVVDSSFTIPTASNEIVVDKAKVHFPIVLRRTATADRFRPFGMRGSKLVSDYLTNLKVDAVSKRKQLVLVDGNGEIMWVVGRRSSETYRIGSTTTTALRIRFLSSETTDISC
ncbi:tRNA lysidine(34) synthetase TilS [Prevotella intermedia]|uniref:tRNA lysidine(34) synthetase TilS n=1 Tax=Prevotella intermedia TaxID=28131 RepID=UPI000C1C741C|nr:tRNA lysidine(34) synthetase TilS [Prevotella intermedia]ATV34079.1 tRNA lysidine(34) synthetase TilS [Prevotella intermedia]ATV41540.1 tRNA lysidine(34) synthetase TilS [Prevotella intermedia]